MGVNKCFLLFIKKMKIIIYKSLMVNWPLEKKKPQLKSRQIKKNSKDKSVILLSQ